jgi:hypothetical protein
MWQLLHADGVEREGMGDLPGVRSEEGTVLGTSLAGIDPVVASADGAAGGGYGVARVDCDEVEGEKGTLAENW